MKQSPSGTITPSDEIEPWDDWESNIPDWENASAEAIDYSDAKVFKEDVALYAPAISETFVRAVDRPHPDLSGAFSYVDLQFTNPESRLFFYPWVLYSAGQAASTAAKAKQKNWLTERPRDPRVVVLGDSGGYQVQQGTIKFTPDTTPKMLDWLERVADQSMILDFPVGGIVKGSVSRHIERLRDQHGIDVEGEARRHQFSTDFMACLLQTEINNQVFQDNRRPDATSFLNVIQGRNEAESRFWYERVKHFGFEGWAFAGKHHTQLSMTLRRLIDMHRDGKLKSCKWIHFLGISTLKAGMALTFLQRALHRTGLAPDVQISFDSASPVKFAATGYFALLGFDRSGENWSFRPETIALDEFCQSNQTISDLAEQWSSAGNGRMRVTTYVGKGIPIRELVTARQDKRPTLNQRQMALLVHHNTQAYIEGFRRAYAFLDWKAALDRPIALLALESLIVKALSDPAPYQVIADAQHQIDALMYEQV